MGAVEEKKKRRRKEKKRKRRKVEEGRTKRRRRRRSNVKVRHVARYPPHAEAHPLPPPFYPPFSYKHSKEAAKN